MATGFIGGVRGAAGRPPLDRAAGFLVNSLGQEFGRRLEIGVRSKKILACTVRGLLRNRVAMSDNRRDIIVFFFVAVFAGFAPALFPKNLEACTAVAAISLNEDTRVGGEPGEDPHLKVRPGLRPVKSAESLGVGAGEVVGDGDEYIIQAEGLREGRGYSLGSRVNLAWRMILWAWLCQLHR